MAASVETLLLAAPRGYCAGVDRAVQTVERALELYGAPVYVRKEIVHNKHVVEQLRERGAVFVDELDDSIPEGAMTVFSAHGVAPKVHADAERRGLRTIDATCPLVTKVHREAIKFAADGYTIVLIGHAGHEEVEGTMGEAPDRIVLVETEADVDALEVEDPSKLAYISQTTLSVDETRQIIARLRERFPAITGPRTDDICYATTNRQAAVKQMAPAATSSWSSARATRPTPTASCRWPRSTAPSRTSSTTRRRSTRPGSRARRSSASRAAHRPPRSSCSAWWPSSPTSASATCRSSRS
jgi:4-hydroxy-3-methylbut-2-enyl diphosphate reductase